MVKFYADDTTLHVTNAGLGLSWIDRLLLLTHSSILSEPGFRSRSVPSVSAIWVDFTQTWWEGWDRAEENPKQLRADPAQGALPGMFISDNCCTLAAIFSLLKTNYLVYAAAA